MFALSATTPLFTDLRFILHLGNMQGLCLEHFQLCCQGDEAAK